MDVYELSECDAILPSLLNFEFKIDDIYTFMSNTIFRFFFSLYNSRTLQMNTLIESIMATPNQVWNEVTKCNLSSPVSVQTQYAHNISLLSHIYQQQLCLDTESFKWNSLQIMVSIQLTLEKTLKVSPIDMKSVQMEENSETLHRFQQFKRCFDTIKARYLML